MTGMFHIHGFDNGWGTSIDLVMEISTDNIVYVVEGSIEGNQHIFERYENYIQAADIYRELYRKYWETEQ